MAKQNQRIGTSNQRRDNKGNTIRSTSTSKLVERTKGKSKKQIKEDKFEKKINQQLQTIIEQKPVTASSVYFKSSYKRAFSLKVLIKYPFSSLTCFIMSVMITLCLLACMQGVIYGTALIYGTHVKNNLTTDLQNMVKTLNHNPTATKESPTAGGDMAAMLVSGGLANYVESYIQQYYSYVHYKSGPDGGVYMLIFNYEVNLLKLIYIFIATLSILIVTFYIQYLFASQIAIRTERSIRVRLLRKILFHDFVFFIENKSDILIDTYAQGPINVGEYIRGVATTRINFFTIVLGVLGVFFVTDKKFALVLIAVTLVIIVMFYLIKKILAALAKTKSIMDDNDNFSMVDRILNARSIKANGTWEMEYEQSVDEIIGYGYKKTVVNIIIGAVLSIITSVIMFLSFGVVAIAGQLYHSEPTQLMARLSSFLTGTLIIAGSIYPMQVLSVNERNAKSSLQVINKILSKDILINKYSDAGKKFSHFSKKIEFRNIQFAYPDEPETILLNNFSFTIQKGQKVGVIGQSGCGKTTLVKLLLGYYNPIQGEILIDGTSLRNYNLKSWLERVAYIDQNPQLLSLSVFDNLTYGVRKFTSLEVIEASKKARIHDLIMQWPDKYKTILEDGGERLSGGQKQRFTLARMILRKAELVLLDEATSKLDSVTEAEVMDEIVDILNSEKITCLSISHRLRPLSNFDYVIKMAPNSGIISAGKPSELIEIKESLAFLNPDEYSAKTKKSEEDELTLAINSKIRDQKNSRGPRRFL
ncbi:ABC transporter ATP-binding protein [Spiroplasma endosymbiont of Aspidapion aeneum]|uniref:ABC transporter ATP-binding protein n=1 Tax=Spiroplasma endosymbiont of Aspidapion aeneum TaxID=3066276 RepID=UPI00313EF6FF